MCECVSVYGCIFYGYYFRLIVNPKAYVLDLDGTLIYRNPIPKMLGKKSSKMIGQHVQWGEDIFAGDSFEGRPIWFKLARNRFSILFRNGLKTFLEILSDKGKNIIHIATHACRVYAEEIAKFLIRHIPYLRLEIITFAKRTKKSFPGDYVFILDDHTERWPEGTPRLWAITSLTEANVADDNILTRFDQNLEEDAPNELKNVVMMFANDSNVRKCLHCRAWTSEPRCAACNTTESESSSGYHINSLYMAMYNTFLSR